MAKKTTISLYKTFGTDMEFAESRLKKMLSVDNPYDIAVDTDALESCSYSEVQALVKSSLRADDFKIVYSGPEAIQEFS